MSEVGLVGPQAYDSASDGGQSARLKMWSSHEMVSPYSCSIQSSLIDGVERSRGLKMLESAAGDILVASVSDEREHVRSNIETRRTRW
jgi:hypothetical protein